MLSTHAGGLPEGWARVRLSEVLAQPLINGRSVKTMADGFPVLRLTAIRRGHVKLNESKEGAWGREDALPYLVRSGDFLVARGNGSLNLVGRGGLVGDVGYEVAFPDTMIRIRVDDRCIAPAYLRLIWDSWLVRKQIEGAARTTAGIYKVNQTTLGDVEVPLPPLAEQHRIVEALEEQLSRLDAADTSLELATRRIDHLRVRTTDFVTAFAVSDGVPTASLPHAAGTLDGNLPKIPEHWSWMRLGELAEVVGGVTKDKKKQSDPDIPEVPYLRVANVQRGRLVLDSVHEIRVPTAKADQLRLRSGDVLMNEGGDRDKLGRGWVWEGQVENAIHQNHVFRARIRGDLIKPELLSHYANGMGRWFEANGKQSTNLASISLRKIKSLPVPVPPRGEQDEILQRIKESLAQIDRMAKAVAIARLRAAGLRNGLLRKAFSGGLVPQDPADERAATLLARVAAERDAAKPARKAKRAARPRKGAAPAKAADAAPAPTPAPLTTVQQELFQ
ncbi:restriction endonuclease subunit S [Streptomyces rimosus]|uniref:restriction endonuclease subunit S n=1 Tax=Streptomyces rimosus TaxID=1927 RepID=UPI0031D3C553